VARAGVLTSLAFSAAEDGNVTRACYELVEPAWAGRSPSHEMCAVGPASAVGLRHRLFVQHQVPVIRRHTADSRASACGVQPPQARSLTLPPFG